MSELLAKAKATNKPFSKPGVLTVLHGMDSNNRVVGSVGTFERYDLNRIRLRNKLYLVVPKSTHFVMKQYDIIML